MDKQNVVITGLGLATPLGRNVVENSLHLEQKKTGIGFFPRADQLKSFQYAGRVPTMEPPSGLSGKMRNQMKFLNRGALLGFFAAHEALASSGLNMSRISPERRSLVVGAGDYTNVGYEFLFPAVKRGTEGTFVHIDHAKLNESSLYDVNPFYILESLHNNLFSFLSALYQLKGPNASFASLSPCGLHALEAAFRMIRMGRADMALVVGCGNWITEISLFELHGLGLLSHCRKGVESFRPLDRKRNGFIPGEGGAALLLERESAAEKRGAPVHGRLRGVANGMAFDNRHNLAVSKKGILCCMETALKEAGLKVADLGFVSPHGNGTRKGDASELESIRALLDGRSSKTPVAALKPYTGHMGAASDVAELILGMEALRKKMVPATLHFTASEKKFSPLHISSDHLSCGKHRFLSVSCGVGGQVAAVAVEV